MDRTNVDPAGKGFLLVGRLSSVIVSIGLGKGCDPHFLQGQHPLVCVEGFIHPAATWKEIKRPDSREIIFLDNNVLASGHGLEPST